MTTITVSTTAQLTAALANAKGGDTILLQGGQYSPLYLYGNSPGQYDYASNVTIKSADPANPAVFPTVDVRGVTNLSFEGLKFDYTFKAGDSIWQTPFFFMNCTNLAVRNSVFDGDQLEGSPLAAENGFGHAIGLNIQDSAGITVEGNEIYEFNKGMVLSNSDDVRVAHNNVHHNRVDALTFAAVQRVVIENNWLHDSRGTVLPEDHRDMIQFWTNGTTRPSTDVVIRNNLIDIGDGSWTQSIFMRNELVDSGKAGPEMLYRNILIENNTITNGHLHGITVGETAGLTIRNNSVLHNDGGAVDGADGQVEVPLIWVAETSTNVTVTKNVTSAVWGHKGQAGWTVADNVVAQDQTPTSAGYYGSLFTTPKLATGDGPQYFLAQPGGLLAQLGAGSALTRGVATSPWVEPTGPTAPTGPTGPTAPTGPTSPPAQSPAPLEIAITTTETGPATRVFDSCECLVGGKPIPADAVCTWTFSDGTVATGHAVEHTFTGGGVYDVELTVRLPSGQSASASASEAVDGPEVFSLAGGRFVSFENGEAVDFGAAPRMTSDGMQLGGKGTIARVDREAVVDVVGTDDMTIAFTLDADRVGTSGQLFSLGGSFAASVNRSGELVFQVMEDGAATTIVRTVGAKLASSVNVDRDVRIDLDDGRVKIWVDDVLLADAAFDGVVGGASGFDSAAFRFGLSGKTGFAGDLSDLDIVVNLDDFAATPTTSLYSDAPSSALSGSDLGVSASAEDYASASAARMSSLWATVLNDLG